MDLPFAIEEGYFYCVDYTPDVLEFLYQHHEQELVSFQVDRDQKTPFVNVTALPRDFRLNDDESSSESHKDGTETPFYILIKFPSLVGGRQRNSTLCPPLRSTHLAPCPRPLLFLSYCYLASQNLVLMFFIGPERRVALGGFS